MMFKHVIGHNMMFAIAALALVCPASAAPADGRNAPQFLRGAPRAVALPRDTLPPLSNAKPYRQRGISGVFVTDANVGDHWRVPVFSQIPNGRLLQIDTIICLYGAAGLARDALLIKSRNLAGGISSLQEHLVGILQNSATQEVLAATGPFYFLSGEFPTIFLLGQPEDIVLCTATGTLWTTN